MGNPARGKFRAAHSHDAETHHKLARGRGALEFARLIPTTSGGSIPKNRACLLALAEQCRDDLGDTIVKREGNGVWRVSRRVGEVGLLQAAAPHKVVR